METNGIDAIVKHEEFPADGSNNSAKPAGDSLMRLAFLTGVKFGDDFCLAEEIHSLRRQVETLPPELTIQQAAGELH